MEIPEGFTELDAKVFRKDDQLLVMTPDFVLAIKLQKPSGEAPEPEEEEDAGPPPPGFEWTGEVRPPRKGEYFWSDLKGQVVKAVKDETGFNQFGQATGGRRILRPAGKPERPALRLVKDE